MLYFCKEINWNFDHTIARADLLNFCSSQTALCSEGGGLRFAGLPRFLTGGGSKPMGQLQPGSAAQ